MDPGELWIYNDQCNPHGNAGKEDDPAVDGSDGCADGSDGCRTVSTGQRTISEKTCTGEVAAATGAGRSAGTVSVNGYCQTETEYLFGYTESDAAGKSHRSHQQRTISDGGDL